MSVCQHTVVDLAVLAKGGRCPACQATLSPEEFRELADRRDIERIRILELQVDGLRAELADLRTRIENLEHPRGSKLDPAYGGVEDRLIML